MSAAAAEREDITGASPHGKPLRSIRDLPGPPPLPILGWRGQLLRAAVDPFAYLERLASYGKLVAIIPGANRGFIRLKSDRAPGFVFAYGPELLAQCLHEASDTFRVLHVPPPQTRAYGILSTGLAQRHGAEHKSHRGMIKPAFHHSRFANYREALVELVERTMEAWKPGEVVDLVGETQKILRLFHGRALLGMDAAGGAVDLLDRLQTVFLNRFSPLVVLPLDLPLSPRRRALRQADMLARDLGALVAARRASKERGTDLLSMLLSARNADGVGLSDDEIVGYIASTVFAGYDTMVHTVCVAAYVLAQFPQVGAKLYEEVRALGGAPPTAKQLDGLPFLDGVVKETLRLVPAAPFIARTIEETAELGGYELPPRTELMLSLYHTHRMPEIWPNPNRFVPERWNGLKPRPSEYLPFSIGPHMCTGWSLALFEMKLMLAMFIQRFRFDFPADVQIDRRFLPTVGFQRGMRMRVLPQDGKYPASRAPVRGSLATMFEFA